MEDQEAKKNNLWGIIASVLGIIGLLTALVFANQKQSEQEITKFTVVINALDGDNFLQEDDIKGMLRTKVDTFIGKPISAVSLREVESVVEQAPEVFNAEAYIGINGELKVEVKLKTVIVRVKPDGKTGYYIDLQGKQMPWVSSFTPRVLVVSGWVNRYHVNSFEKYSPEDRKEKFNTDLYNFSSFVYQDAFWSKQLVQVHMNYDGDAELVTLIGNQRIVFGSLEKGQEKLEKLKLYYDQVVTKVGWLKYKEVNLKFDNQIVCK